MEELQDAIEDAQYIMAMHDDIPKPTEVWKKPTIEQMKSYQNRVAIESKGNIDAAYICAGCLGFYMFLSFCKDTPERILGEFILDVALFRSQAIKVSMNQGAKTIMENYLLETSKGNKLYSDGRYPDNLNAASDKSVSETHSLRYQINLSQNNNNNNNNNNNSSTRKRSQILPISVKKTKIDLRTRPANITRRLLNPMVTSSSSSSSSSCTNTTNNVRESSNYIRHKYSTIDMTVSNESQVSNDPACGTNANAIITPVVMTGTSNDIIDNSQSSSSPSVITVHNTIGNMIPITTITPSTIIEDHPSHHSDRHTQTHTHTNNAPTSKSVMTTKDVDISSRTSRNPSFSKASTRNRNNTSTNPTQYPLKWENYIDPVSSKNKTNRNVLNVTGAPLESLLRRIHDDDDDDDDDGRDDNNGNGNKDNDENNAYNNYADQKDNDDDDDKNVLNNHTISNNTTSNNNNSTSTTTATTSNYSVDMFDELDEIVFQYLSYKHFKHFLNSSSYTQYTEYMAGMEIPITEDDFIVFRTLGRGGFGLVSSCKRAYSGKLYAMKMMNKKRIKLKKSERLCLSELQSLKAVVDSKYIVSLKYSFTTSTDVFLILDIMTGGDLGFHLQQKGQFTIREARYYIARTLMALKALHEVNIVFRDLKPENILMDKTGRTKISDLGLAIVIGPEGVAGACGTRGYWAPEMLIKGNNGKREKYTFTVDYFSLGVCLYEFLYGVGPFRTLRAKTWGVSPKDLGLEENTPVDFNNLMGMSAKNTNIIYQNFNNAAAAAAAVSGGANAVNNNFMAGNHSNKSNKSHKKSPAARIKEAAIDRSILEMDPEYDPLIFDDITRDLIQKLLIKNPRNRLGGGVNGSIQDIMNHPFFASIDFFMLDQMDPPYKPDRKAINAMTQSDIGTFRDSNEAEQLKLTPEDQDHYKNWEYVCTQSYEAEVVEFLRYEDAMGPILPERDISLCCTLS